MQLTPRGGGGGLFTLGVATPVTSSDAGRRPRQTRTTTTHMVLSLASEKIPSDTTGDRSRDLPTSSAVP
jgi:hypothetical protein